MAITHEEIEARRFAARKREIVGRILPVVEQLLEQGDRYRNVTVEQIARRSGMARSSFYRYFSDKHELLIAVSAPALDAIIRAALRPWISGPRSREPGWRLSSSGRWTSTAPTSHCWRR